MNTHKILSSSPIIEVMVRNLYWRIPVINHLLSRIKKVRKPSLRIKGTVDNNLFPEIINQLRSFGVDEGDLLIVHTSRLKNTGLMPDEICKELIKFLGKSGTLAMPAIPFFKGDRRGMEYVSDSPYTERLTYDVQKTPAWTGSIPTALMKFDGAVRSHHPFNTMVAVGRLAKQMMKENLDCSIPAGCDENSSWKFCADHKAKIIFLDVDAAHCMTMIHVAEDCYQKKRYAHDWYRERLFKIVDGNNKQDITLLQRHPKWAMYYAERTLQKNLIEAGILKIKQVKGVTISFCESESVLNHIISHKSETYPYWIPFWKRGVK